AAKRHYARIEPVGCGSATMSSAQWYFIPLRTQSRSLGVVGIARDADGLAPDVEAQALLATLAEQTPAALERALLTQEMLTAQNATETERVRNVLLASVSHDFRTPPRSNLCAAARPLESRHRNH